METELKVCPKCHLELPIAEFVIANRERGYRRAHCRACERARVKKYYQENAEYREACKVKSAAWAKSNPPPSAAYRRKASLKTLYGISPEQYSALLLAQEGKCALCRSSSPGRDRTDTKWKAGHWNVDHCHANGHVRGLLCHACNTRLGSYEALMREIGQGAVTDYLTRPSPVTAPQPAVEVLPAPRFVAELPEKPAFVSRPCSVDGCEKPSAARGFCQKHYVRFLRRNGDVGGAEDLPHQVPRGESHPKSKLTEEHVREIRASAESGVVLAAKFGVTPTLISNVRNRKVWKDVA